MTGDPLTRDTRLPPSKIRGLCPPGNLGDRQGPPPPMAGGDPGADGDMHRAPLPGQWGPRGKLGTANPRGRWGHPGADRVTRGTPLPSKLIGLCPPGTPGDRRGPPPPVTCEDPRGATGDIQAPAQTSPTPPRQSGTGRDSHPPWQVGPPEGPWGQAVTPPALQSPPVSPLTVCALSGLRVPPWGSAAGMDTTIIAAGGTQGQGRPRGFVTSRCGRRGGVSPTPSPAHPTTKPGAPQGRDLQPHILHRSGGIPVAWDRGKGKWEVSTSCFCMFEGRRRGIGFDETHIRAPAGGDFPSRAI